MAFALKAYSRSSQFAADGLIFAIALAVAYVIRFEGQPPPVWMKQLLLWLAILPLGRLIVNWAFGIYKLVWRFVSVGDAVP